MFGRFLIFLFLINLSVTLAQNFRCNNGDYIRAAYKCDGDDDCRDGEDEANCSPTCKPDQVECANGDCIAAHWICDADFDCKDKSDELNCSSTPETAKKTWCKRQWGIQRENLTVAEKASESEIICSSGKIANGTFNICGAGKTMCVMVAPYIGVCPPPSFMCEGTPECTDGEDEDEKVCANVKQGILVACPPERPFHCHDKKRCISTDWRCDQDFDCGDGSDEWNCTISGVLPTLTSLPTIVLTTCNTTSHFRCSNDSSCILRTKLCNGNNDCPGGEDEFLSLCGQSSCAVANGNCQDICVDTVMGHYCDCKPGYKLIGNSICEDIDECQTFGVCSQECVNEVGTFKCLCAEGYMKESYDHTRCKAVEGNASLLFALTGDIRKISLESLQIEVLVQNTSFVTAIDFMFKRDLIFMNDNKNKKIYKMHSHSKSLEEGVTIVENLGKVDGLAVDWIYNNVYWTDEEKKEICVTDFEGKMKKTLFKDNVGKPRAIAVSPAEGWLFWTDWGLERIERSGLDGSQREIIVNTGIQWPNGLTLDILQKRVYWVDGFLNYIRSVNYDGSDPRLVLHSIEVLSHPFSISVFEDTVYWTEWSKQTIFKANKFNGNNASAVISPNTVRNIMSVHVYHPYRQPDAVNHCDASVNKCSHFCLPKIITNESTIFTTCACPDGVTMGRDGRTCEIIEATTTVISSTTVSTLNPATDNTHFKSVNQNTETFKDHYNLPTNEKVNQTKEGFSGIGIFICIGISVLIVTVIALSVVSYRYYFLRDSGNIMFDNPVYHRTTENEDNILIESRSGNSRMPLLDL